jgi:hypothetical protein
MMDDQQEKRVLADEPAHPYDGGREAPKDPDSLRANGFIPALRFVGKGDSLESVAREVKDPALGEFDWRRLAHYNWGTTNPREINWYLLRDCHAALAPTKSGLNVMFVDDAVRHMPHASLWVPHRVASWMQGHMPVARVDKDGTVNAAPTVLDTMFCPFLDVPKGTCRVAKLGAEPMKCWPPSAPLRDVPAFDLAKYNSEKAREALEKGKEGKDPQASGGVEMQSARTFTVSLNTWTIRPTSLDGPPVSITLTEFHVDLQAHQAVGVRDDAPSKGTAGPPAGAGHAADAPPMVRLAHSIGMLIDAGQLQRVVMRGYEDRAQPRFVLSRVRTGRDRAANVLKTLQQQHHLPLYDEFLGKVEGLIPVALVGGGAGDAPPGQTSASHDVVLVDLQTGDPLGAASTPQVYALQKISHWLFAEITHLTEPENNCSMLHAHDAGLCKTPYDVARAREAAAAYARILLSLGGKNAEVGHKILQGIHRWSMVNKEKWTAYEGLLTRSVIEDGMVSGKTGEWPAGFSLFKAGDPPNHGRHGTFSQVTASFDSLREISAAWWNAERSVPLAHRIPSEG